MKKVTEFIKKNKGLSVLMFLGVTLLIIIIVILIQFLKENGSSKYGYRLNGIDKVKITDKRINKLSKTIKENDEVNDVDIRVQGKIIYINITYNKSTELEKAKNISNSILSNFDEKELKFYDISCFLIEQDDNNDETEEFMITGNKHRDFEEFTFIKS